MKAAEMIVPLGEEPLINVLCSYEDCIWRIMIFLRSKHRPEAFYREGEKRIFVSPGTIDMAGVVITPLELNFRGLDCTEISSIYEEVSLPEDTLNRIIAEL
jgi:hypothetical protein